MNCERAKDYEETGRLKLRVKNLINKNEFGEIFDGVMVCSGHNNILSVPQFLGQEKFKGKVIHTQL